MKKIAVLTLILLSACAPAASPAPESFFASTAQPGMPGTAPAGVLPVMTESGAMSEIDAGD